MFYRWWCDQNWHHEIKTIHHHSSKQLSLTFTLERLEPYPGTEGALLLDHMSILRLKGLMPLFFLSGLVSQDQVADSVMMFTALVRIDLHEIINNWVISWQSCYLLYCLPRLLLVARACNYVILWKNSATNKYVKVSPCDDTLLNWPVRRAYWGKRCRQQPPLSCCWGSFYCVDDHPLHQRPFPEPRATSSCEVCICVSSIESCHHQSQAYSLF